jgi:hypothetical protein
MNCVELQQSLAGVEDGTTAEQNAHLRGCPACSTLVKELNLIIAAAGRLQEADEPSPRVWNSIEIALRREGLVRPQPAPRPVTPSFIAHWRTARWFVPAAVMLVLAAGIFLRQRSQPSSLSQQASLTAPAANQVDLNRADLNDDDLMQEVSDSAPAMKTQYQDNLRRVNESIRDAQNLVEESPNDEDARRSLMDAYQQKTMLFELAMDRSLP